jgi:hypothetical protein
VNRPTIIGILVGIAVVVSCIATLPAQSNSRLRNAKDVKTALPEKVVKLMSWPTPEQRAKKTVGHEVSEETRGAVYSSIEWIRTIIRQKWLPPRPEDVLGSKLLLFKGAFNGLDASYIEWERNGYCFRVSQTSTVIYIAITAKKGRLTEANVEAMRKASRELAAEMIKGTPEAMIPNGVRDLNVAPQGTKAILMRSCFDDALVEGFKDGIVAKPARIDSRDYLDAQRESFWWGIMRWWTDGRTLGLFTVKVRFSQWAPSYRADVFDKHWLSGDPPELRSKSGRAKGESGESDSLLKKRTVKGSLYH